MADVSIRGLSEEAVAHINAAAAAQGLSRQQYLRRRFEADRPRSHSGGRLTIDDLRRASAAASELDDPEAMDGAWH